MAKTAKRELKPITRKTLTYGDGKHLGWSLYVEDYEAAVEAMALTIMGYITGPSKHVARKALAAIGIDDPCAATRRLKV